MGKQSYWWLLITAVLLLSIQVMAVVIYIYSFIPYPAVWNEPFLKGVEPERETLFYLIFLSISCFFTIAGVKWVLPLLSSPENDRKFKFWLMLEALWAFLIVFCFIKWTSYRYPFWNIIPYENQTWLLPFFYGVCALSLLSKIFFPEINNSFKRVREWAASNGCPKVYSIMGQLVLIALVIVLLYIPKTADVVALALLSDQWVHLDLVAAWFIKQGWYVNYEQLIQLVVLGAMAYCIALFYFIRQWLNSWLLAASGVLLVIKFGMFYYGTVPCIWINPGNSFLLHGWDIALFFGLWFISVKYPRWLYLAASLIGIFLVWSAFKSSAYIEAFGLDNQPMMAPLRVRQFFPYFMGYFVPIFYVFSLMILMGMPRAKDFPQKRLPVILCVYGLLIFVDYIEKPMIGFYGALMVPAILVMLWWLREFVARLNLEIRRAIFLGILFLALGALLTNRLMVTYPNLLFQDQDRFAQQRNAYEHFEAMKQPAALIDQLIPEEQKVVLISNFETALLMQAHRTPVFEEFPLMFSSLNNDPGGLNLRTKEECLHLINEIAEENALYVFVDTRLLSLSPEMLGNSGLKSVLDFLNNHYKFYTRQGFITALERK